MKNAQLFFLQLKEKVPSDSYLALKQSLDKAEDKFEEQLALLSFKNPIMGLIFSVILPGVDRIYKGDLALGIFKIIYFVFVYIFFNLVLESGENDLIPISLILFIVALIWLVVDIFLVFKGIKRENLKLIFSVLQG